MYMRGVTAIEPQWLPDFCPLDCNLSKPLSDREPFYDSDKGQIMTFRTGTFGERGWPLPLIKTVHPTVSERTKYFAKFFLEGQVIPELKDFQDKLLSAPVAMIKTWGTLHSKRTKPLFEALLGEEVDSKEKFLQCLKNNPKFLLNQYLNWLDEDFHKEVRKVWAVLSAKCEI